MTHLAAHSYVAVVTAAVAEQWRSITTHAIFWLGIALSAVFAANIIGPDAPVWERESVYLGGVALPLSAAACVHAAWIGGRPRRHGTGEIIASTRFGELADRMTLVLLAAVPVAATVILQTAYVLYVASGQPVGSPILPEILAGPLVVLGGWLVGASQGIRFPRGYTIPALLLFFAFTELLSSPDITLLEGDTAGVNWSSLALWTPPSAFDPAEVMPSRPSGLKLAYLAGVCAWLLVGLFSRPHRVDGRGWGYTACVIGLAAMAFGLVRTPEAGIDWPEYITDTECQEDALGIEYCHLPLYGAWVDRWSVTLENVAELAPVEVSRIVQRPSNVSVGGDVFLSGAEVIVVGTEWDRPGTRRPGHALRLALAAAFTSVRLPTDTELTPCSAAGQGRAVYSLWLALRSVVSGDQVLTEALSATPGGVVDLSASPATPSYVGAVYLGREDARLALAISALSQPEANSVFARQVSQLGSAELSSHAVASWFGLEYVGPVDDPIRVEPCE